MGIFLLPVWSRVNLSWSRYTLLDRGRHDKAAAISGGAFSGTVGMLGLVPSSSSPWRRRPPCSSGILPQGTPFPPPFGRSLGRTCSAGSGGRHRAWRAHVAAERCLARPSRVLAPSSAGRRYY